MARELGQALREWERVHQALDQGDPAQGLEALDSPPLQEHWSKLHQAHQAIAASARELLACDARACQVEEERLVQAILRQGELYLPLMDKLVFLYDEESRQRVRTLRRVETVLDVMTLLGLALVGLLVFRPMVRRIGQNLERLTATAAMFKDLSFIDSLTSLANRRALDLHLEQEWRRQARVGGRLALVLLDVDHFKQYNDALGHCQGDLFADFRADTCLGERSAESHIRSQHSRRNSHVFENIGNLSELGFNLVQHFLAFSRLKTVIIDRLDSAHDGSSEWFIFVLSQERFHFVKSSRSGRESFFCLSVSADPINCYLLLFKESGIT